MDAGRGLWQRLSVPRTPPLLSVPVHAALAASALLLLCLLAVPVLSTADGGTLAAVAVAAAGAAALAALTVAARDRIRPAALGLAWALMLLWPLAGRPLPAAGIAVIAAALVIRLGATGPAARGLTAPAAVLAAGGVAVLAVAWLGTSGDPGVLPVRPAADRPPPAAADPAPPAATQSARGRSGGDRPGLLPRARPARVRRRLAHARPGRARGLRRPGRVGAGLRGHAGEPAVGAHGRSGRRHGDRAPQPARHGLDGVRPRHAAVRAGLAAALDGQPVARRRGARRAPFARVALRLTPGQAVARICARPSRQWTAS